eukprot:365738-Chlamydomonas_euryale.AAC.34
MPCSTKWKPERACRLSCCSAEPLLLAGLQPGVQPAYRHLPAYLGNARGRQHGLEPQRTDWDPAAGFRPDGHDKCAPGSQQSVWHGAAADVQPALFIFMATSSTCPCGAACPAVAGLERVVRGAPQAHTMASTPCMHALNVWGGGEAETGAPHAKTIASTHDCMLSQLISIELQYNNFSGDMPSEFPAGMQALDVSNNPLLSGALPEAFDTTFLERVSVCAVTRVQNAALLAAQCEAWHAHPTCCMHNARHGMRTARLLIWRGVSTAWPVTCAACPPAGFQPSLACARTCS